MRAVYSLQKEASLSILVLTSKKHQFILYRKL